MYLLEDLTRFFPAKGEILGEFRYIETVVPAAFICASALLSVLTDAHANKPCNPKTFANRHSLPWPIRRVREEPSGFLQLSMIANREAGSFRFSPLAPKQTHRILNGCSIPSLAKS